MALKLKNIPGDQLSIWNISKVTYGLGVKEIAEKDGFSPEGSEFIHVNSPKDLAKALAEKENLRPYNCFITGNRFDFRPESVREKYTDSLKVIQENFTKLTSNSGKFITALLSSGLALRNDSENQSQAQINFPTPNHPTKNCFNQFFHIDKTKSVPQLFLPNLLNYFDKLVGIQN